MKKFTICYEEIKTGAIFCEHGEGGDWPQVARRIVEKRVFDEGRITQPYTALELNAACNEFSILFAFKGRQTQLI